MVVLSVAVTGVVVATALVLARALGPLVTGEATLTEVSGLIGVVGALFFARAALQMALNRIGHIGARAVIADLRAQVLRRQARLGPRWAAENGAATGTLLTRGLDALDPYFTAYLPQLVLTVVLTPALLVVIATQDLIAAVTLAVVIPLIPIFMWLIGVMTNTFATERLAALTRLGAQLLDLVAGLPTLRAFGRALGPVARVRELAERARATTMTTLRVAFLSGAALELLATIGVAMVAVGVGLRLVGGTFDLTTGLALLILAPEVLLPLRQVGVQFHNAADGVAAADGALTILALPPPATGAAPAGVVTAVQLDSVSMRAGDRDRLAPADLSFTVRPGRITVLAGPSGAGKTTAMQLVLGLLSPDSGSVLLHRPAQPGRAHPEIDLGDVDLETWWPQLTWVPQRPTIEPGTLAEIVAAPAAGHAGGLPRDQATAAAGFTEVIDSLPTGWDTPIGRGGVGLSVGQLQRLALTRALMSPARFLVLDEPTAHLDAASEEVVVTSIRAAAAAGKGVLVIAHRTAVIDVADEVITVTAAQVDHAR